MSRTSYLQIFTPARTAARNAQVSNEQFKPAARPVGLFFGGTSGIGQAMAEQLAHQTNGRAHIILLGRNQEAANKIIASFPQTPAGTPPNEESKYSFIKVDATSMAQVRDVTAKLSNDLEKINFIVATAGYSTLKGRDESPEGIDRKIACTFYARFRFIHDLAPLVEKTAEKQETTGIMSVFAPGRGSQVDLDDLGLVKGYSIKRAHDEIVTYNDAAFEVSTFYPPSVKAISTSLFFQEFASRYPNLSFVHAFPGLVTTPAVTNNTGSMFLVPLIRPFSVTPEQCAQVMWWRLWNPQGEWKTGAHQLSHHGEELEHNRFVTPEVRKAVWEHAVHMTGPK